MRGCGRAPDPACMTVMMEANATYMYRELLNDMMAKP